MPGDEAPEVQPHRPPTNVIKLEFANYAHVEVKRRGSGTHRRYTFDYWGQNYTWERHVRKQGEFEEVSYHLARGDKSTPLAYIVPVPLTREQSLEERWKGGWIAPTSMWMSDDDVCKSPDVAEYVEDPNCLKFSTYMIQYRCLNGFDRASRRRDQQEVALQDSSPASPPAQSFTENGHGICWAAKADRRGIQQK